MILLSIFHHSEGRYLLTAFRQNIFNVHETHKKNGSRFIPHTYLRIDLSDPVTTRYHLANKIESCTGIGR